MSWLIGWLIDWLVGWLIGQSAGQWIKLKCTRTSQWADCVSSTKDQPVKPAVNNTERLSSECTKHTSAFCGQKTRFFNVPACGTYNYQGQLIFLSICCRYCACVSRGTSFWRRRDEWRYGSMYLKLGIRWRWAVGYVFRMLLATRMMLEVPITLA